MYIYQLFQLIVYIVKHQMHEGSELMTRFKTFNIQYILVMCRGQVKLINRRMRLHATCTS